MTWRWDEEWGYVWGNQAIRHCCSLGALGAYLTFVLAQHWPFSFASSWGKQWVPSVGKNPLILTQVQYALLLVHNQCNAWSSFRFWVIFGVQCYRKVRGWHGADVCTNVWLRDTVWELQDSRHNTQPQANTSGKYCTLFPSLSRESSTHRILRRKGNWAMCVVPVEKLSFIEAPSEHTCPASACGWWPDCAVLGAAVFFCGHVSTLCALGHLLLIDLSLKSWKDTVPRKELPLTLHCCPRWPLWVPY